MSDQRKMTAQDIADLIDLHTPLDGYDEYLRFLHKMYFDLTGSWYTTGVED
jgi:hypothetical protein